MREKSEMVSDVVSVFRVVNGLLLMIFSTLLFSRKFNTSGKHGERKFK